MQWQKAANQAECKSRKPAADQSRSSNQRRVFDARTRTIWLTPMFSFC
jgi:hypothetical protein